MNSQFSKKPKSLPKLSQLAIIKLKKFTNQITDVGNAPYHLLEPVLQQMQSRQLNELETTCDQLLPYSDELWKKLIEKDFPNRPTKLDPLKRTKNNMPYRTLYYKYCQDRENFRKDSAKKLRNANKSIEKEKSRTKIVAVNEVLKDPSIKARRIYNTSGGYHKSMQPVNKNSILEKVKRDTMHNRSLVFGRSNFKPYDPFDAFKVHKSNSLIRPPRTDPTVSSTGIRRTTFFNATGNSLQPTVKIPNPRPKSLAKVPDASGDTTSPTSTSSVNPTPVPQQSSIFLQPKRKTSSTNTPRKKRPKKMEPTIKESPSKIKPLKSSIFS